jgi:O-antigen/teichoic acid export membrane protein
LLEKPETLETMSSKYTTSRLALFFSFVTEYVSQLLTLISVVVMARLLSPDEYGTYSLAVTMIMLFQHITAFGVGQFVIKTKYISYSQLRSAIGFIYISAWGLGLFIIAIAPFASDFYNEPGVEKVLYILSIYFFLTPLAGIVEPHLKRNLEFKLLSKIILLSKFLQIPVTLFLAFNGFSYYSLAIGLVLEKAFFVSFLIMSKPDNIPNKPRFKEFGEIFKFGSKLSFYGFCKQFRNSIPELLMGKIYSIEQVGYFARALGGVQLFNRLITKSIVNVLLPIFSKEQRESKESSYLIAVSHFSAFSFSFYALLFLLAEPTVHTLYGDQWGQSIPLLKVLCIWAAISSLYAFSAQQLISAGNENSLVIQEVVIFPLTLIILGIASFYGVFYIVTSLILISVIEFLLISKFIKKSSGITLLNLFTSIYKSLIIAIATASITTFFYTSFFIEYSSWSALLISSLIAFFSWLISIKVVRHPLSEEMFRLLTSIKAFKNN